MRQVGLGRFSPTTGFPEDLLDRIAGSNARPAPFEIYDLLDVRDTLHPHCRLLYVVPNVP